jgi:hypothetical protein
VRVIEHVITLLATNSKTAYCMNVNKDVKNYTNKLYYIDVLKGYYGSVKNLTKIEFVIKLKMPIFKRCVWEKCKRTSRTYCNNEGCEKYACNEHLLVICDTCFYDDVLKKSGFDLINFIDEFQRRCFFHVCKKRSKIGCVSCKNRLCMNHRYYLCMDCANLHSNSAPNSTFSHKFKSKRMAP